MKPLRTLSSVPADDPLTDGAGLLLASRARALSFITCKTGKASCSRCLPRRIDSFLHSLHKFVEAILFFFFL
jgi:hypothetical protein